jgi:hypothetical protein
MTSYQIGLVGEIGSGTHTPASRAAVLMPLLAAALVIALGLVLVGLTSGGTADQPTPPPSVSDLQ